MFHVDGIFKDAIISDCGNYRYRLDRVWDRTKPQVLFVMLNPSRADAKDDDPTIRQCIALTRRWGYGGFVVANLFAFRSPDRKILHTLDDPVGPHNDATLMSLRDSQDLTICAWGNDGTLRRRDESVFALLNDGGRSQVFSLGLTKSGNPRHPARLRLTTRFQPWSGPSSTTW